MHTYTIPETELTLIDANYLTAGRTYVLKIKDMPSEDKPREKLLNHGPSNLSVAELLAIVLTTGSKNEDVLALANRVVKEYGERALSSQHTVAELTQNLHISSTKAAQIIACSELGRRFFHENKAGLTMIRTAQDVYTYARDMERLSKEHLRGLYLNAHYRIIHDEVLSIGSINTNIIHPREVFKPALEYGAVAVVLVHNHPSGSPAPSAADVEITEQLVAAGKIMGIHLIDHVVIGAGKYASVEVTYA